VGSAAPRFVPNAKAVLGAGLAPLPGQRISSWWSIDAQVEVKKEPKPQESGAAAASAGSGSSSSSSSSSSGGTKRPTPQRPRLPRGGLDISVIKEESEEEGEEGDSSSEDEEGWAAQFAEEAGSLDGEGGGHTGLPLNGAPDEKREGEGEGQGGKEKGNEEEKGALASLEPPSPPPERHHQHHQPPPQVDAPAPPTEPVEVLETALA